MPHVDPHPPLSDSRRRRRWWRPLLWALGAILLVPASSYAQALPVGKRRQRADGEFHRARSRAA